MVLSNYSVLASEYGKASQKIATYLITLQKPTDMSIKYFRKFRNHALCFRVLNRHLFRRDSRDVPCRRVIDKDPTDREVLNPYIMKAGIVGVKWHTGEWLIGIGGKD